MHDKNGNALKVGDRVMLEAIVTEKYLGEEFCNVTIESCSGRRPDNMKEHLTLNTGVLTLLESSKPEPKPEPTST